MEKLGEDGRFLWVADGLRGAFARNFAAGEMLHLQIAFGRKTVWRGGVRTGGIFPVHTNCRTGQPPAGDMPAAQASDGVPSRRELDVFPWGGVQDLSAF